jgi:ABC-type transport system substrate-binding protein
MRWIRARSDAAPAALACAAAMLLAVPVACSPGLKAPVPAASADDAPPRRGGTLRMASFTDVRSLDPAGPTDGLAMQTQVLLFDGLVDFDRQGRVVPNLAERWEVTDEGRTYRFTLRAGVLMHDGAELTAADVKRSVERALHPTTPGSESAFFEGLTGFAAYAEGKAPHLDGVVVEGRYQVAFHLDQPDAAFLALVALRAMRPVCASAGDRYLDAWLPCGAGPFKLESGGWQRGTSLRLVRHEGYFRPGRPYLDAIEWTFNVLPVPQRFRFEDGDIDLIFDPLQSDVGRFLADPRWKEMGVKLFANTTWGEAMNTRVPPFDRVEVRRAVAAAIDREHYAILKPSQMSPASQLLPPGVPGYDASFAGQTHDEAAALEHMRRAGYPFDPATGAGGWPEPVVYTVTDVTTGFYTAQLLQQTLARIGLRLELRLTSWPAYLALIQRAGASAMHPQGNQADYADPSAFFDPLFTTAYIRNEGSSNTAFFSNPAYDDLVARARHEMDPAARGALYRRASEILRDEAPWAFTYGQHDYVVRQPYVRGFAPHPVWPLDVRDVWLDREALPPALGSGAPR